MVNNITPSRYVALVAEMVRQEAGGKVSALGIYADGTILVGPNEKLPVTIQLAFYYSFLDGEGLFDVAVTLQSPSGAEMLNLAFPEKHQKLKDISMTLNVNLGLVSLGEWGEYSFFLSLDGKKYERKYDLRQSSTPLTVS